MRRVLRAGKWEGDRIAALIFPTAEYSDMLRDLTSGADSRLVLIVNPQWTLEGQVVSDFGLGAEGQRRSKFVESFQPVYCFKRLSVFGDRVTLMRVYPGGWQVYWAPQSDRTQMIGVEYRKPSFQRLVELLRPHQESRTAMSWLERVRDAVPQSQGMQSWAGLQYGAADYKAGMRSGLDMVMRTSDSRRGASGKPVASESTVFVNASGDLDVNMQRHFNSQPAPGGSTGNPWGTEAWQGAGEGIAVSGGDLSYSRHQSASGPLRDDIRVGAGGTDGSEGHLGAPAAHRRATENLEEALAELTGDSSNSGGQDDQDASAPGGWQGPDHGVFGRLEPPGAWSDFGKASSARAGDGDGAGASGDTDLQKVARLRTQLHKVDRELLELQSERSRLVAELGVLSGRRPSQILHDSHPAELQLGSAALQDAPSPVSRALENEPLWQGDGAEAAKDMKNNMLDLFKGMMGRK
jgi:Domain of unknown function (DUF1995)